MKKKLLSLLVIALGMLFVVPASAACTTQPEPTGFAGSVSNPATYIKKIQLASSTAWNVTFQINGIDQVSSIDFGAGSAMGFTGLGWIFTGLEPRVVSVLVANSAGGASISINGHIDAIKTTNPAGLLGSGRTFTNGGLTGVQGNYNIDGTTSITWLGLQNGVAVKQKWLAANGCHNADVVDLGAVGLTLTPSETTKQFDWHHLNWH